MADEGNESNQSHNSIQSTKSRAGKHRPLETPERNQVTVRCDHLCQVNGEIRNNSFLYVTRFPLDKKLVVYRI